MQNSSNDQPQADVLLNVGPVYTKIGHAPHFAGYPHKQVVNELRRVLSAEVKGGRWTTKYKKKQWDGRWRAVAHNKFPTGLLDIATEALENFQERKVLPFTYDVIQTALPHEVIVKRAYCRNIESDILEGEILRDYQLQAVQNLIGAGRGVAHMATNSGKTFVIGSCAKYIGGRSLVVVNGQDLLYQTTADLLAVTGMTVGRIGDKLREIDREITVSTIQSLWRLVESTDKDIRELIASQDAMFIDECHHTSAPKTYKTIMKIPAIWRYGLSGTPLTLDDSENLRLRGATGKVVAQVTNKMLIDAEWSAKPHIYMIKVDPGYQTDLSYQEAYTEHAVESMERNHLILRIAKEQVEKGRVVYIPVDRIKHVENLLWLAKETGFDQITGVTGSSSTRERREQLERMRQGVPGATVATIYGEGTDVPAIGALILASPRKSHIDTLQRLGRGMREKSNGDNVLPVFDFDDRVNTYLRRHANVRRRLYEAEGFHTEEVSLDS